MSNNTELDSRQSSTSDVVVPTGRIPGWLDEGDLFDFRWIVNGQSTYATILERLPSIFAWNDPENIFASLGALDRSVCARRLQSAFDHIRRYELGLSRKMRECFEALPPSGKSRFMMAPETIYRVSRLRKTPAESIVCLCNFLNGESALHGRAETTDKQYWTALGDFYYAGPNGELASAGEDEVSWNRNRSFRAPRLSETITIDFFSPNIANGKDGIDAEYLEFSSKERFLVCQHLEAALSGITAVSDVAGRLVKEFVKVIIPYKVAEGHGSTSQPRFPGRVLLRGVEESDTASLAGSLVHEAIHQLLYVLEYEGKFLVDDAEAKASARVTSLWSGRALELHSFFHACFVWYGLANFWGRAQSSNLFEASSVQRELTRCLSGFRGRNPVESLGLHAQRVRPDALSVAGKLQGHLQDLVAYCAAA